MVCKGWRIVRRTFIADAFSGKGCDFADGRWHTMGNRVVYASETLSTAMLELLANGATFENLRDHYVSFSFSIDTEPLEWTTRDLEQRTPLWRSPVPISFTQNSGDRWILSKTGILLRVPSAVVPVDYNLLINPAHPDAGNLHISGPFDLPVDERLLLPARQ
jgi:RES domain-containing protein